MDIKTMVGNRLSFSIYGAIEGNSSFEGTAIGSIAGTHVPQSEVALVNHSNIWPAIPEEIREPLADSFTAYDYLIIATDGGSLYYLGDPWINMSTVIMENIRTATVVVESFTDSDASRLRSVLESNGYTVGKVDIA